MFSISIEIGWQAEMAACRGYSLEEWMSCRRKIRYGHLSTAKKASLHMERKTGDSFDEYRCDYCGGWHIGHSRR